MSKRIKVSRQMQWFYFKAFHKKFTYQNIIMKERIHFSILIFFFPSFTNQMGNNKI